MNLLLTCSTVPEFTREAFELWSRFCVAEWLPGQDIVPYLRFPPASEFASIDAIVFLQPNKSVGFAETPDGRLVSFPEVAPWEAHWYNAAISKEIRDLPENCAMRDGRKWKRIPQIVLTEQGYWHDAYAGLDVEFVTDVTEFMLFHGYSSPITWNKIAEIISQYHRNAMEEYEKVGFLVTIDRGLYRVRRAFHKKPRTRANSISEGKTKDAFTAT